jgi:membrane fusion protein, multidrug efflux system
MSVARASQAAHRNGLPGSLAPPRRFSFAAAVVSVACSAALTGACGAGGSETGHTPDTPPTTPAATVAVSPVLASTESIAIRATGSFAAIDSADVSMQAAGRIVATPVDVGQRVNVGDVIARLDDRDARARLAEAMALLQQADASAMHAQAQASRSAGLLKTGDVSLSDFQTWETQAATTRAQVAQAKAQLTVAEQDLAETIIRAPFRGQISARPVSVGAYVTAGSPVATVVRSQPIRLELHVTEADAARIRVGMAVMATVVSYGDRTFAGRVIAKNPVLSVASRALSVIAEFENRDLALSPGMFATAALALPETAEVLSIPTSALFTPAGSSSPQVFVALDGKVRLRVVQVSAATHDIVRVVSGLDRGDVVVTSSPEALIDGQAIAVR